MNYREQEFIDALANLAGALGDDTLLTDKESLDAALERSRMLVETVKTVTEMRRSEGEAENERIKAKAAMLSAQTNAAKVIHEWNLKTSDILAIGDGNAEKRKVAS